MLFSTIISVQYDTPFSAFPAAEWERGLDWIRACGLDAAELCISHYEGIDLPRICEALDRRGLACSTLSTGQSRGLEGLSLSGVPREIRERTIERFEQHIRAAAALGSKVTIGLLRGADGALPERRRELCESMLPLVDCAGRHGVTLVLEPLNRYETTLLNTTAEMLDFIENDLGAPEHVGILWDLFHANIEDPDYAEALRLMGSRLQHVHVADSNRFFPGYGHLDLEGIMRMIRDSGYREYISFECFNLPSVEAVRAGTAAWVAQMRRLG